MIRIILLIAFIALAVMGLDWLSQQEGTVKIDNLFGFETRPFSLVEVTVALVALIVITVLLWSVVAALWRAPKAVMKSQRARRRQKGYEALSRGMLAVGAGDAATARRYARKSKRHLQDEPLVDLLTAQSAQLAGDKAAARKTFKEMLDKPQTHLLGLRGLYIEARRENEREAVRHYVNEAARVAPNLEWAGTAKFENLCASGEWEEALNVLQQNLSNRLIDKNRAKRLRAVLLTGLAQREADPHPDKARGWALEAHRLAPDLVPAAIIAAQLLSERGNTRKASHIIETVWKVAPHPHLATAYAQVRSGDSIQDRFKRVKTLVALNRTHRESYLALAAAAIDAQAWDEARQALGTVLAEAPTQRSLAMMAELEQAQHDDIGAAREWLARAMRAPKDAAWVAGNFVSDAWAPISPETGALDAFEWKAPAGEDEAAQTIILELQQAREARALEEKVEQTQDATLAGTIEHRGAEQPEDEESAPADAPPVGTRDQAAVDMRVRGPSAPIDKKAANGANGTSSTDSDAAGDVSARAADDAVPVVLVGDARDTMDTKTDTNGGVAVTAPDDPGPEPSAEPPVESEGKKKRRSWFS